MIRSVWAYAVFVVATVILAIPAIAWSLVRPGSDLVMRLARSWSRWTLAAAGVRPDYVGSDDLPAHGPCVFLSNHQSALDILALVRVLPPATRFVAKESIFRIPFLGWAMAASGFIPIDRKNRERAVRSLSRAAEIVRSGRPVLLFPEGTRSRDGRLGPFKRGAFHLACEARVGVIAVAISGSGRVLPPGAWRVRPGPVRVSFAPVRVPSEARLTIDALLEQVRRSIVSRLEPSEIDGSRDPVPAAHPEPR